ncbi:MAG TPA: hypothetical protein ENK26_06725 [Gammaproteobacteria bacterium]|nr:hypothetical protein [Gammaproteobacteria bacterium]
MASQYFDASTQTGLDGFEYFYDEAAQAPYLYNRTTREFITFDKPRSVESKGRYVLEHRLGGLFSREIDADNGDLVDAMNRGLAR